MATFDGKHLKGLVGNLVVRKGKNKQIVQTVPASVKQTIATKKASGVFGKGSKLAGAIRQNLDIIINKNYDSEMINRFNAPVTTVLRQCYNAETEKFDFREDSFERLAGFEFNSKSLVINSLWVKPEMRFSANTLTILIPEIKIPGQLKFPARANVCELGITLSQIALKEGLQNSPQFLKVELHKEQEVIPAHEFTFEVQDGICCVAGIGLNYYSLQNNMKTELNSKTFNPAAVIGAIITPGTFTDPGPVRTATGGRASDWTEVFKLNG